MDREFQTTTRRAAGLCALLLLVTTFVFATETTDPVPFTDIKAQTSEFIALESSIKLTPEQEAIKREALEALPAPCCSDNTAYTCCCPCNMSLAIWGLSELLITEHGYNAEQVRTKVSEWIEVINPDGFSGNVCYTGGCRRPFAENGCGGMIPGQVTWGD